MQTASNESKVQEAVIEINGMTCHSCVNNIEETAGRNDGVNSISISLNECEGWQLFHVGLSAVLPDNFIMLNVK